MKETRQNGLNGEEGQRRAEQCGETGVSASGKHVGNMPENTWRGRRTSQAEHPECLSHRARRAYKYSKAQGPEKRGFAVGSHLYCLKDSLRITGKQRKKKLSNKHA